MQKPFRFLMAFVLAASALAVPVIGAAQENDVDGDNDVIEEPNDVNDVPVDDIDEPNGVDDDPVDVDDPNGIDEPNGAVDDDPAEVDEPNGVDEVGHDYHLIENDFFLNVWERTDLPVEELAVDRTWIWGPGGFTEGMQEEYAEAEDGERLVQYFDKSRMEMPIDEFTEDEMEMMQEESPWFITQGLLATELMTGNLQLGDDTFEQHDPSERSAAGDPDDVTAPTYAALGGHMDLGAEPNEDVIDAHIDRDGEVTQQEHFADYGIANAEFDDVTEQNIASVFWDHMNSDSTIYDAEADDFVEGELYENPYYAVGRPLTEAFWADVTVDGVDQDVLIQAFERRVLTYTPDNPEGWEVESGNIGQHYHDWRYNEIDDPGDPGDPGEPGENFTGPDGETDVTIGVDEAITLTALVEGDGEPLEGEEVFFEVDTGDEYVSLDPESAISGEDGTADVTVTGEAEGTAEVEAWAGTFHLGTVTVTVGEDDDDPGEPGEVDGGSFLVDGDSEVQIFIDETATATVTATLDGEGVADIPVAIDVEDVDGNGAIVELDESTGTTDEDGNVEFVITGVLDGETTLTAFADLDDSGDADSEGNVELGTLNITVGLDIDNGDEDENGNGVDNGVGNGEDENGNGEEQ